MKSDTERRSPRLSWHESAELLLEGIPGVASATIEGTRHSVFQVRVWYEPTWPVGQVVEAVRTCLTQEAKARLAAARLQAIVAEPDRRTEPRPRPQVPGDLAAERIPLPDARVRLVGHRVEEVEEGVVGVEVWLEWQGRTFSGAAVGPEGPPGSLRTPALATLRALHSCLQVLYDGPVQPGLVLESAVETSVDGAPVAVVAITASENARARSLTAAWADQGASRLAIILATLHATSRTVTRWLRQGIRDDEARRAEAEAVEEEARRRLAAGGRFTLLDFQVDRRPSGSLDVGVKLGGFGEAIDRRREGEADEHALLELGAYATLDAVHDLLRVGGWRERHDGDLRRARARRLRTGEHDLVVVLTEALMNGHRVPLAGATSADDGLERASITATLQATNTLVADRTATILRTAWGDDGDREVAPARA